jgi:small subunit ribosomal protein S6
MEKYELLYVLPAKFTEEELSGLAEKVKGIVESHGGTNAEETYMGKRKLAYPIQHHRYGHYYLIIFEAEKAAIAKLNGTLRLTTDLLRHLIVVRDPYIQGVPKLAEEMVIVRRDERKDRDRGPRRRGPAPSQAPLQSASQPEAAEGEATEGEAKKAADKVSMDDLDKKLDKILTDDVL